jgi:geranylgeranyl diphosphate synthase type II
MSILAPQHIEEALLQALPVPDETTEPARARLLSAMRGAVSNGGKRLRFRLLLEAAHTASTHHGHALDIASILPAACAIEFIHAYSLVHDDLPAMDDADTRRGRPACHKEFGEATAILVGDALLTLAFEIMAQLPAELSTRALRATAILAQAAGEAGMVGGQMIDIAWSNNAERDGALPHISGEELLAMHALKTGALIRAACKMGGVLGGGDATTVEALSLYGAQLGRAFQLKDDLLDVEGDPAKTGKSATDVANDKITAPAFFGLEETRHLTLAASDAALSALGPFGIEADALRQLAHFVAEREK